MSGGYRAGKEVLLKTVIQSLPTYAIIIFLLHIDTCNDLERMMAGSSLVKFYGHSR